MPDSDAFARQECHQPHPSHFTDQETGPGLADVNIITDRMHREGQCSLGGHRIGTVRGGRALGVISFKLAVNLRKTHVRCSMARPKAMEGHSQRPPSVPKREASLWPDGRQLWQQGAS